MSQQNPSSPAAGEQTTALATRNQLQAWTDPDWQRFWLTVDHLPWRTLALIPAGEGAPADFTLSICVALSRTGMTHRRGPIQVADGTQVPLRQLSGFMEDVRSCVDSGQRVLIALSPATSDPTTPAIAQQVDGVVLCVLMGRMRNSEARKTIKLVGAQKFLGSVILRASDAPPVPAGK